MTTVTTQSETETIALAAAIAQQLRAGDVIALEGDLGAGKTRFVQGLAQGLGHDPARVNSPTYVVMHEYEAPGAITLIHVDAYRLDGDDDAALGIGWDQVLQGDAIVAIEWPARIANMLPEGAFRVEIEHIGAHARRLSIACPAGRTLTVLSGPPHTP
ncbi:MAG: tRNA (adenosine(37)-N6)-threonylcarbamoyltransferase complex ATPase subunit type 1 TsaE [Phycisphaerales bacterium]|nr:tRNA (adenosine(37)-N6)-threonylcarbamoyltransferase complex ATPase subunit type 1 TsaE [Phycisphaerales bacterium]